MMPDQDGYPTEGDLQRIKTWTADDPEGWLAFIRSCWWASDWGWTEFDGLDDAKQKQRVYLISTGGWSGNEELLSVMQANWSLWMKTWESHRRGGHWEFRLGLPVETLG